MVHYKQTKWRERSGDYNGSVKGIEAVENKFYKPEEENSTEETLNVTFEVIEPDTMEVTEFTQKFVNPLTGGTGLFQQLLDAKGILPELEEGDIDVQDLIGMKLIITFGKRENKSTGKSYDTVVKVAPRQTKGATAKAAPVKKVEQEEIDVEDLPF